MVLDFEGADTHIQSITGQFCIRASVAERRDRAPAFKKKERMRIPTYQPSGPYSDSIVRPLCLKCDKKTWLTRIELTDRPGYDKRTFECPTCEISVSEIVRYK